MKTVRDLLNELTKLTTENPDILDYKIVYGEDVGKATRYHYSIENNPVVGRNVETVFMNPEQLKNWNESEELNDQPNAVCIN